MHHRSAARPLSSAGASGSRTDNLELMMINTKMPPGGEGIVPTMVRRGPREALDEAIEILKSAQSERRCCAFVPLHHHIFPLYPLITTLSFVSTPTIYHSIIPNLIRTQRKTQPS